MSDNWPPPPQNPDDPGVQPTEPLSSQTSASEEQAPLAPPSGPPAGPYRAPSGAPPGAGAEGGAAAPLGPPAAGSFGAPPVQGTAEMHVAADGADPAESTGSSKRSKAVLAGGVAALLAVGAAGTFAVAQLGGDDASGGAASPAEAGTAMLESLGNEDVLGMMDLLLPGERETFRQPMIDLFSELGRIEVLSADLDLASFAGFDIEVSDAEVDVEPTNVDDIVNIEMRADMTLTIDGEALPIGDLILDTFADAGEPVDLSEADMTDDLDFQLPMTAVEDDGRWYLSMGYSVAEEARGDLAIPAAGIAPTGGDSPEAAVDALLAGVERLDVGAVIAALNPDEFAALQRYAPLFVDDANTELGRLGLEWEIVETEYRVSGEGDRRFVAVESLQIDGSLEGEPFRVRLDGGCVRLEVQGDSLDSCDVLAENGDAPTIDELLGSDGEVRELIDAFTDAFDDYEQPDGITVRNVDDRWYVSPIASGSDQVLAVLRALDRAEIERIIDAGASLVDSFGGLVPELLDEAGLGDVGVLDGGLVDDGFESGPGGELVDDSVDDAGGDGSVEDAFAIVEDCYRAGDGAAVAACLGDAIDAGQIDSSFLAPELAYPECGVADLAVNAVDRSSIPDAEYAAAITAAAACFERLADAGEIFLSEVSPEFIRADCYGGRNPFRFDADDADEFYSAWLDCVFEF